MFVLTKPATPTMGARVPVEVESKLQPLAFDIERVEGAVTYKISSVAPGIRYSMFVPFSEAALRQEGDLWVLRIKPTKLLLVPLAFFLAALLMFRSIGPVGMQGFVLAVALPSAVDADQRLVEPDLADSRFHPRFAKNPPVLQAPVLLHPAG